MASGPPAARPTRSRSSASPTSRCPATKVTFKNPANGKVVTAPVIDRGPYVTGRQWDLRRPRLALGHCYTGSIYGDGQRLPDRDRGTLRHVPKHQAPSRADSDTTTGEIEAAALRVRPQGEQLPDARPPGTRRPSTPPGGDRRGLETNAGYARGRYRRWAESLDDARRRDPLRGAPRPRSPAREFSRATPTPGGPRAGSAEANPDGG